jgi:hypothetical protein
LKLNFKNKIKSARKFQYRITFDKQLLTRIADNLLIVGKDTISFKGSIIMPLVNVEPISPIMLANDLLSDYVKVDAE